jgi:hypothetical protein
MGIFDEQLDFQDLLRATIINFYKEYIKEFVEDNPWFTCMDDYQVIVHNIYKSGVNSKNLNKYELWAKHNHKEKITNIYIKLHGSFLHDGHDGFPIMNKRGTNLITLDKIIEND